MGEVVQFKLPKLSRRDFKKVGRKKNLPDKNKSQLNLFNEKSRIKPITALGSEFDQALLLDEQGNSEARNFYQQAIDAGEQIADAYCNLGILEFNLGQVGKALECFTQALKTNPTLFEAHYNLGNLYFHLHNLQPARVHYEIASKLDSSYPHVYYNMGIVLVMDKKFDLAVKALTHYRDMVSADEAVTVDELLESLNASTRS